MKTLSEICTKSQQKFLKTETQTQKVPVLCISLQFIFIENYNIFYITRQKLFMFDFSGKPWLLHYNKNTCTCTLRIITICLYIKIINDIFMLFSPYIQYQFKFIILQYFKHTTNLPISFNLTFDNNKLFSIFNHWLQLSGFASLT